MVELSLYLNIIGLTYKYNMVTFRFSLTTLIMKINFCYRVHLQFSGGGANWRRPASVQRLNRRVSLPVHIRRRDVWSMPG